MSWKALFEKSPGIICDPTLRPHTTERKVEQMSVVEQKIVGSTVAASWPQIVCFSLYATGLFLLIHFAKLDEMAEEKIDNFQRLVDISQSLSNIALMAVTFLVGASVFGAIGKYAAAIQIHFNFADAVGTFTLHIFSMMCRDKASQDICITYYEFENDCWRNDLKRQPKRFVKKRKAVHLIEDIQDIMRALPFAFKHNARTQTSRSRFETNIDSDVDLKDSTIDPRKLPMMEHLIAELFIQDSDYITGLLNMASVRVGLLSKNGVLVNSFESPMVHINAVGTQVATISALQVLGLFPPLADLFYVSLCVVFTLLPFPIWITYGFFGLIIYCAELCFVFSLYGFGRKVGNPYNRVDDSPFTFHDLGGLTRDVAANVDNQMDTLIGEMIAFRDTAVICGRDNDVKLPTKSRISLAAEDDDEEETLLFSGSEYNIDANSNV